jgi:hypothetical protein
MALRGAVLAPKVDDLEVQVVPVVVWIGCNQIEWYHIGCKHWECLRNPERASWVRLVSKLHQAV